MTRVTSVWNAPQVNGRSVLPVCGGSTPETACYCGHALMYHNNRKGGQCWACGLIGHCPSYAQRPEEYRS